MLNCLVHEKKGKNEKKTFNLNLYCITFISKVKRKKIATSLYKEYINYL